MEENSVNANAVNTLFKASVPLKGSATDFAAQVKDFDYWPPILTRICWSGCN
jgi:hypothetical protein